MRRSPSELTTKTPITKEAIERRSKLLCSNMKHFGQCSYGDRCHYSHVMTRQVYDPRSHKREPSPPKQAPQTEQETEEEIIKKLINDFPVGKSSKKYLTATPTMSFLQQLVYFNKSLVSIAPSDERIPIDKKIFVDAMNVLMSSSDNAALKQFIQKNIAGCTTDEGVLSVFNGIRNAFALPSEVMNLFDVSEAEQASYAGALKVNHLELARRTPDAVPSKEFLDYISSTCGLSNNNGFKTMRSNHELLGTASAYKVKEFLAILTLYEVEKEATIRLEAFKRKELAVQQEADVKVALMRECLTTTNPHLKTAFMLLKSLQELTAFAKGLSEEEQKVLISVFGSFVAYLSHNLQTVQSLNITSEFLMSMFDSFTKSRRVDKASHTFKSTFFNFVKTPDFEELKILLAKKTSSIHRTTGVKLDVGEVFKRMLKEILPIYLDKVHPENRDKFCIDLVKGILPFAYLLFLDPNHSYMLSGQWKKGYRKDEKDETLHEVYDYAQMLSGRDKSILYWLLQGVRTKDTSTSSRKKKISGIDSFEKLSSMFTSQETGDDGQSKTVFNPKLLFDALTEILKMNFLNAGDFTINQKIIQSSKTLLFKIDEFDDLIVSESISDEVAYCLYMGFGSNETDLRTRQFSSDTKPLFKHDRKFLLEVVSSCTTFHIDLKVKSVAILKTMGIKDQTAKIMNAMKTYMNLLDTSERREDLLRRAYDIMSIANKLKEIQGRLFFMSLVDALLVVLLQDKFEKLKFFDIISTVYTGKIEVRLSFQKVKSECEVLDPRDPMKQRLRDLLCEGAPKSDKEQLVELGNIVQSISPLLGGSYLPDDSPHEIFKAVLPFILDPFSMTCLLGTVPDFEQVIENDESPAIEDWLYKNADSFFKRELERFISGQANQISFDLAKRMKEVVLPADRLKAVGFLKYQSSMVNLINSVISSIGLPYKLSHETFCSDFPKTARCENPEELITNHAIKALSSTEQDSLLLQSLILKAIHAVRRTEVPKSKEECAVKVDTVLLSVVKTELGTSDTIDQFFKRCLPYWKLDFVRELILGILHHFFSTANVDCVHELYNRVLEYDIQFSENEKKNYIDLFSFLKSTDDSIQANKCYENTDEDFLQTVKDSIVSDHWNDAKTVEVSKPVVRKAPKSIQIRRVIKPDEVEMTSRGAPAPEPEPEPVSEEDSESEPIEQSKGPCDIKNLRSILASGDKMKTIDYLNTVLLEEALQEIINYLMKEEDSKCADALEALNQYYD